MKTEDQIIKENPRMSLRYKNAHRNFGKIVNRIGKKDTYFILKKFYSYIDNTGYKPEFPI